MSTIGKDDTILKHFYHRSSLVFYSCFQNFSGQVHAGIDRTGEKFTLSTDAKLSRIKGKKFDAFTLSVSYKSMF